MRISSGIKKFILLFLTMAIIAGGLFFDVRKAKEALGEYERVSSASSDMGEYSRSTTKFISARDIAISAALEVRDLRAGRDVVSRQEISTGSKRIIVISLILFILLAIGAFYTSVLPSIFPWTSLVISRFIAVNYIHLKDGKK